MFLKFSLSSDLRRYSDAIVNPKLIMTPYVETDTPANPDLIMSIPV